MDFAALYSAMSRPSIAPEKLLRAMLLQAFYSVRSERQLMERLHSANIGSRGMIVALNSGRSRTQRLDQECKPTLMSRIIIGA